MVMRNAILILMGEPVYLKITCLTSVVPTTGSLARLRRPIHSRALRGPFTVTAADFVSLSPGANANPTSSGFLNLASGSDLINGGVTSTGITYNGSAPDLGAIESGATTISYTLTTSASPTAGGSVSRSPNAASYNAGTVVTLRLLLPPAIPSRGWSGDATGSATSVAVTMNSNKTVTANFTNGSGSTYTLTTTTSPSAGGTIARSPNAASYAAGTVVTLTATPASGYTFSSWSGGASGTNASTTVTMNANTSVTANFNTSSGGTTTYALMISLELVQVIVAPMVRARTVIQVRMAAIM